jgi:hypothetical protein
MARKICVCYFLSGQVQQRCLLVQAKLMLLICPGTLFSSGFIGSIIRKHNTVLDTTIYKYKCQPSSPTGLELASGLCYKNLLL